MNDEIIDKQRININNIDNNFPEIKSSDRIVIFSPHPDDDVIANFGLTISAMKKNAAVKIVYMTNGDGRPKSYLDDYLKLNNITNFKGNIGEIRHAEALNGLHILGLNDNDCIFLGYPDSAMKNLFLDNWDYDNLFKNKNLPNSYDHSPYTFSFEKKAPYCGMNVVKNLNQILNDFKPNIILTPDPTDDHGDHWATNAFVQYVTVEKGYNKSMYHFLIHKEGLPIICAYCPCEDVIIPLNISVFDAKWMKLPLSDDDKQLKRKAINSHESQIYEIEERNYLESFIRINEYFTVYPKIKIQKIPNYSLKHGMPKSSFKNVVFKPDDLKNIYDPLEKLLQRDLDSIGLIIDNQSLYSIVKSNKNTDDYHYIFHLYLYDGKKYKKLDIDVKDDNARYISNTSDNIIYPQKLEVQHENDMIGVKIPLNIIKGTKNILIAVDIQYSLDYSMNTTPLRVFEINIKLIF
ncbi:MAG: PIG-L family deacetylase [Methanobrevibacter sp.]|jgi:LmbE family N-acetylglucosaminyl deacetylase|nr:PIG-L family deacetylase [Methanobrevibacter sp.]